MKAYTLWYYEEGKKHSAVFFADGLDDAWSQFDSFLQYNNRHYITHASGLIGRILTSIIQSIF